MQQHCCDSPVATLRLLQQRVVMRTAAMLDLVDDCAKTSWTQAIVSFPPFFMCANCLQAGTRCMWT